MGEPKCQHCGRLLSITLTESRKFKNGREILTMFCAGCNTEFFRVEKSLVEVEL